MSFLEKIKRNSFLRKSIAFLAHLVFGFPARNLIVIGVTGTTGKTTTCFMIKSILESNGIKTGLISTAGFDIGPETIYPKAQTPATTPDPFMLCFLLRKMKKNNVKAVVIETSSFGLMYERVFGLKFSVAVLTNISFNHHLTIHGGMEEYVFAKLKLFQGLDKKAIAVLPKDSEYFDLFSKNTKAKVISFSSEQSSDLWFEIKESTKDKNRAIIYFKNDSFLIDLPLLGVFNLFNCLAAIGAGQFFSLSFEQIKKGLESLTYIPGRLEEIKAKQPFTIIVDKANTPAAFCGIIEFIKTLNPEKKRVVYGNFGETPREERDQLAQIATGFFDLTIITEDDPQELSPQPSIDDFLDFVKKKNVNKEKYLAIPNRKEAIRKAINLSKKGDLIAILGRGNEKFMDYGEKTIVFDDREVTREVLKEQGY
ncbi:MAG: UDP-N-acetylmuramyl-tripeptide synthetase [Candidatus Pacebacteria bacterium]|nr:UDP-N-acetylmuramyl-tripeptide synthetase [Candidatus Paceibacterota bacterium]MDD5721690.1 UDP-N-acetylmuramyl-tripeptide synthetase [Candidatus Paceibacterota bacterium]